jgi:phosphotransferase family enzyme
MDDVLEKLRAIDPKILTNVVRQDLNNPAFEITEWTVQRLSDKGIANPDGLWLFSGWGNNGKATESWSAVLKILKREEQDLPPSDLWYWKREFLLAQSGLTQNLPRQVKAPRFYDCEEMPESAWLWMEHIETHDPVRWALDDYAFAAYQLGQWNSVYLTGASLPDGNWLARQHYRTWLGWMNYEKDWKNPLNQKYVSEYVRERYDRLWNEREQFYEVLERLPQVFSHFDCHRKNLGIRLSKEQEKELIILDWAQCGIGAIGTELNWLVGMSSALLEWPPSELPALDTAAFQSYIQGLQEAGWSGDIDIVRLGYVTMLAVFIGLIFPGFARAWCSPENREFALQILGSAEEELFLKGLPMLNYALDCADEARALMQELF